MADDWFGPFLLDDQDLLPRLRELGRGLVALVPAAVGLSLSLLDEDVTFTVASSAPEVLLLDALQYADDGPCMAAMRTDHVLSWADRGAEEEWRAFAAGSAAAGVRSTLSLPIVRDELVIGGFNLYAASIDAFDGRHQEVADLLGAWGEGATTNADLSFSTRDRARLAPQQLRDQTRLALAAALLAQAVPCEQDVALDRLRQASFQAATPLASLVDGIISALGEQVD